MLSGCGGAQPPIGAPGTIPSNVAPDTLPYHKTFDYTGAKQSFKVPAGVKSIAVVALGAAGASCSPVSASATALVEEAESLP